MRLLFLTDNFPPEVNAPASRTYEHCKEWVKQGVDVTVITCAPNFPKGKVYPGYKNKWHQTEVMDGIKVIRVWTYMTANEGIIKRTLDFISFMITSFWAGLFVKTDLIVATSPQFFTALSGSALAFFKRKKWVMEVRDLWPESIKAVGAVKDNPLINVFEWLEKRMYRSADKIVVVTHSMKKQILLNHRIANEKVAVVTNGINPETFVQQGKAADLKKQLGLTNKFVIGYVGTHGMAHGLDFVLRTADKINSPDIHFLLIGDGAKRAELLQLKEELQLTNVTMLPSVAKNELADYYAVLDVGLVNLIKSDLFLTAIPSKIFELAYMDLPILMGVEGEAAAIIKKYNAGIVFEPENEMAFVEGIEKVKQQYQQFLPGCKKLAKDYSRNKLANSMLEFISS